MESVELAMAYEESFGVSIPDAAAEKMRTPHDVIEWLVAAQERGEFFHPKPASWVTKLFRSEPFRPGSQRQLSRSEIADEVRRRTLDILGLPPDRYAEDARFIEDFGIG